MKIEELNRASEGDILELEGTVYRLKEPNSNDFDGEIVWGQFIVLKDSTGEQGAWLKLGAEADRVSKGTKISIRGKLGKEYTTSRGAKARSINNCDFEVLEVQVPAESKQTTKQTTKSSYEQKDDYWTKKFKYEVKRDPKVQLAIVRQTAIKTVVDLISSKVFIIKTKKDFYASADEIVEYIFKGLDIMESAIFGGETKESKEKEETKTGTKEERIKKAEEIVGDTNFKPATTKQKNFIYGYKGEDGIWKKGMIESRYIETHEIEEIGDPKKLSIDKASEWINFWLGESGNTEDIGERQKRELDNPRDSKGVPLNSLVKGNETSLAKDILVDEVNALRRKCRLNDDEKFKKEIGYSPKIESLTEKDLTKVKEILKGYAPF